MTTGIKIERTSASKLPEKAYETDAGYDVYANRDVVIEPHETAIINLGFKLEIPVGWECQVRARSSLAKRGLSIPIGLGTVDSGYRGEVKIILTNITPYRITISKQDRIGQLVFKKIPPTRLIEAEVSALTERGVGGFGSTGR